MPAIEKSLVIPAPPEKVWEYMTDYQRYQEWMVGFEGFRIPPREKRAMKGTATRQVWKYSGLSRAYDVEVTEYVANTIHVARASSGEWHGTWTLEPTNGSTRVTWVLRYRMPFSLLGVIADKLWVGGQIAQSLERSLHNVKRHVEHS